MYTHNPFNPRTNLSKKTGGQNELVTGIKHEGLQKSVAIMQEQYGDMLNIKYVGLPGKSISTRYKWGALLNCVYAKHGNRHLYKDSKGKEF
jgi:hypothetical protein